MAIEKSIAHGGCRPIHRVRKILHPFLGLAYESSISRRKPLADQFNLHGGATRKSPIALLLIDVINDMEFEEGHGLLKQALPAARKIAALKKRAQDAGI